MTSNARPGAHIAGRERCDIEARWDELAPASQDLAASVS
jgi:hypothetical protein